MENKCREWGDEYRNKENKEKDELLMSPQEKYISVYGDTGQAERLVNAKKHNQSAPNSPFLNGHRAASSGPIKGSIVVNKSPSRNTTPGGIKQNQRGSPFISK